MFQLCLTAEKNIRGNLLQNPSPPPPHSPFGPGEGRGVGSSQDREGKKQIIFNKSNLGRQKHEPGFYQCENSLNI
jgi:hypothetical protein